MAQTDSERSSSSISVYIVAENRLLREALVRLFKNRAGISVFGESRYSDSASEQIAASQCDVLLLDSTEATLATTLIGELNENAPEIKIVLFGMDEDTDSFLRAVRCGVRGYVLKEASSAEIIAAVRGVVQGEAICPPRLCMSLIQFVSQVSRQRPEMADQRACIKLGLTHRQGQLMTLVARGLTNKEIAANLNLSEFTVKNHIHRIMKQVHAENRQEAVDVVRAGGFLANA
jgi:two-component system, NarL family, nitrate/nitrite response regulator NarL